MRAFLRHPATAVVGIGLVIAAGGLLFDSLRGPEGSAETGTPVRTNGEIAFVRGGDIWTVSPDGSGPQTNITGNGAGNNRPSYSFDGAAIAYETEEFYGGDREPAVMAADGSDRRPTGLGLWQTTAYAPNGLEIAVSSSRAQWGSANADIFVLTAPLTNGGTNELQPSRNLTGPLSDSYNDFFPAYSADGSRIAFARGLGTNNIFDIWAINSDGSGAVQLTSDPADDRRPTIAPDGRIAFASKRDGDYEIYLMNADGSGLQKLTDNTGIDTNPAFSADGQRIAFESNRSGSSTQIHTMKTDGSDVVQVTTGTSSATYPAWRPVLPNEAPTPSSGGPYSFSEGEDTDYDASGSSDPEGDPLRFLWHAGGGTSGSFSTTSHFVQPWIPENALDGPADLPDATVWVIDGYHVPHPAATTVRLLNAPPTLAIGGPESTPAGEMASWTFTATDPSLFDQNRPMTYKVDWTGDGTVDDTVTIGDGGPASLSHAFAEDSTPTISATATDKDGGESTLATKTVTVGTGGVLHSLSVTKSGDGSGTVTSTPPGIDCGPTCSASFNQGVGVTLTAEPASGSLFGGWSGGSCSGAGSCVVTVGGDASVEARFDLPPAETTPLPPPATTTPTTPTHGCKKGFKPKNGKCVKKKKKKTKKK